MGRSKRVLYDGAVYHIVQRGHNKDRLFRNAEDYKAFKDLSQYYRSSYNFYIKGRPDAIITENPLYKDMAGTPEERQRRYRGYVMEERSYDAIVDKAMLG